MANQTASINGKTFGPMVRLTNRLRSIGRDLVYLTDLQGHLFLSDWKNAEASILMSIVMVSIVGSASLAGLIIFATGVTYLLNQQFAVPLWLSFVSIGATLLMAAIICGIIGFSFAAKAAKSFSCSRVEARKNIDWIRNAILHANDDLD